VPSSTRSAEETRRSLLLAMEEYEAVVLSDQYRDQVTGLYKYPYQISKAEVLRRAGVKSRSTLSFAHHAELEKKLDDFISDLKVRAGKKTVTFDSSTVAPSAETLTERLDKMAQSLIAQQYRIIALERENHELRTGSESTITTLR
jgi:hypothetical protein